MTVSSMDAVSSSDSFALLKQGLYYLSLTIMELAFGHLIFFLMLEIAYWRPGMVAYTFNASTW